MPRGTWLVALLVLLGIFFAGYGAAVLRGRKQVKDLQHYSDSVAAVMAQQVADAEHEAERLRDSAQTVHTRRIVIKESADSIRARADSAESRLAEARTAADSVPILVRVVADLKRANDTLNTALTLADAEAQLQKHRGDTLLTVVTKQAAAIVNLNQRIQNLTPTPAKLPQWLRTSMRIASYAGAFYGGMQFERQVVHGH